MKLGKFTIPIRTALRSLFYTKPVAWLCANYVANYFDHLQWQQWRHGSPEWFDHRIDYYRWYKHLNPVWVERGVYSKEVMFSGCKVLDIACGDGLYAHFFYVATGATVDCIDINGKAIAAAKRYHAHPNIRHIQMDAVKEDFPQKSYDVVCFDGAIDHFNSENLNLLLRKIKKVLGPDGVLTGYQELETRVPDAEHPIFFPDEQTVQQTFEAVFENVGTLVTHTPGRVNCYLRCSSSKKRMGRFLRVSCGE